MNHRLWVVTYDIADKKRWRKVFRLLKSYGYSVQYSVFECRLSDAQMKYLSQSLGDTMDEKEDRVHIYPLCGQCDERIEVLGRGKHTEALPNVWIISDTEGVTGEVS